MPLRFIAALALAVTLAAPPQDDRGRPVILMLHGRGMLDRDTAELRKLWFDGLNAGDKRLAQPVALAERDVRLVWYADVLDPRSTEACDYAANDPRARRDAATDPDVKSLVSLAGGIFAALTSVVADTEAATQIRALQGDASFLGDVHKRCASEQRLVDAVARATREGRPVILVAHSLGSIIAYDYLSTRRDTGVVQRLVSVGSMLGSTEMRRFLIGGDSTETLAAPVSVRSWVNIRNEGDGFAVLLPFARDILTTPPDGDPDQHEMVSYLRNSVTAGAILGGWCAAFTRTAPAGCETVER